VKSPSDEGLSRSAQAYFRRWESSSYLMMMIIFTYINYNEKVSQNLYSIRFHTDQPKRHKYKKISITIRNKGYLPFNRSQWPVESLLNMSLNRREVRGLKAIDEELNSLAIWVGTKAIGINP
jgi:hypothetical protein